MKLYLPAFYTKLPSMNIYHCMMKLGDINERVKSIDEINLIFGKNYCESLMQKVDESTLAYYKKSYVYTFGIFGGKPEWHSVEIQPAEFATTPIGIIALSGEESIFFANDQDILYGMRLAMKGYNYIQAAVPVVFIPFMKS